MKNGNDDKLLGKGSEEHNMNIDEQADTSCRRCKTSYDDFPSLVGHKCFPNRCTLCPAMFDMDYELFFHTKKYHDIMHGDGDDQESINCKSKFVDSLDENSQLLLNHTQSCDTLSCEMCKKPLSSRNKSQFCPTCLGMIKKDNRDYNLRFKNVSPSNKNVLSNYVSHKNTLNASVTNLENKLVSVTSNFTVGNKDIDGETSVTHQGVKRKKNGYTDSRDRNVEKCKRSAISGRRIRNINESEQNIHTLETKIKNRTMKYLEDVQQNSTKNHSASILKDVPSTSKHIPIHSIDSRKKFVKRGTYEKSRLTNVKRMHGLMNRRAEIAVKSLCNVNSALQGHQSKVLNLTHEEQGNRSRNYLKKTTASNSQTHSKRPSGKVSLSNLIDSLPDNDCGILLQSQSPNESNFKCAKCNKVFRSPKLYSAHFPACKVSRLKKIEVELAEVKWACIVCHSHFVIISELMKHRQACSDFQLHAGSSKQNLDATVNKLISDYDHACVNWCPKCSYGCISSVSIQNHSCKKRLEYMCSCFVLPHKLPAIDVERGEYLYECRVCKKVFVDNYLYSRHMASHPNRLQYENVSPLILNPIYRPEVAKNIKTEVAGPKDSKTESTLKIIRDVLIKKKPDDRSSETMNYILSLLSTLPSTSKTPNRQLPTLDVDSLLSQLGIPAETLSCSDSANHSAALEGNDEQMPSSSVTPLDVNMNYHLYNLLICKCQRRLLTKGVDDNKPCPDCLTTDPPSDNQQETVAADLNTEEVSESNMNAGTAAPEPILNSTGLDLDISVVYETGSLSLDLMHSLGSALTPPVSHSGLTPPPTPDNFTTQYSTHASVLDRNTNGETNGPAVSHPLPEEGSFTAPTCPGNAFSEDENMPELQIDLEHEQESSLQVSIPITHLWTDDNLNEINAWAILSSKDSNTVEKYVCPLCFCSHDQNSLPNHLRVKHEKYVSKIIALYVVTPNPDVEKELIIDSDVNVIF